jgi:hypothetical protein
VGENLSDAKAADKKPLTPQPTRLPNYDHPALHNKLRSTVDG